jgi:hypothetical protein
MVLGAIIRAMLTPILKSLGVGTVHRVVPYGRYAHSGLVQYAISAPHAEGAWAINVPQFGGS